MRAPWSPTTTNYSNRDQPTRHPAPVLPVCFHAELHVVVAGAQPPIARAAVELDAPASIGVIRIRMAASLKVRGERVGRLQHTRPVRIREPCLAAVRARKPSEKMIERSVLHHEHDDVLDARVLRFGKLVRRRPGQERTRVADTQRADANGRAAEETAAGLLEKETRAP